MWDVNTHKCLATLVGHTGAVRALAASDSIVFSGSDDTTIRVRAGGCGGAGLDGSVVGVVAERRCQAMRHGCISQTHARRKPP